MTNPKRTLQIWFLASIVGTFCCACNSDPAPPAESMPVVAMARESAPGTIAFAVDQLEQKYEYLPEGANFYHPLASAVSAKPAYDAAEELTLNLMGVDLNTLDYPVDLKNKAGIIYIDSEGTEWAGPVGVRLESYDADGVLTASFTNVSLPHTEKTLPNVVLSNGRIEAQVNRP